MTEMASTHAVIGSNSKYARGLTGSIYIHVYELFFLNKAWLPCEAGSTQWLGLNVPNDQCSTVTKMLTSSFWSTFLTTCHVFHIFITTDYAGQPKYPTEQQKYRLISRRVAKSKVWHVNTLNLLPACLLSFGGHDFEDFFTCIAAVFGLTEYGDHLWKRLFEISILQRQNRDRKQSVSKQQKITMQGEKQKIQCNVQHKRRWQQWRGGEVTATPAAHKQQ